ncbi:unnamed protein product [Orchesella dallaii]|uniref:LRRCT domain-containing protein n=1 Tax=Orchesella dallaii TaxID=48710 RepID=A0ABP1PRL8_9HEXA
MEGPLRKPYLTMKLIYITVFTFTVGMSSLSVSALCPSGCSCDDEKYEVNCEAANLEIVPITLNPYTQRLSLQKNRIRNVANGLQFYHELIFLDISHNHLLQSGNFISQSKLVELHLNANKIARLDRTFGSQQSPMNNLAILSLQKNLLDTIDPGVFLYTKNLAELDLSQNSIKHLNISAFLGLSNLRLLTLEGNELTEIPDVFSQSTPIPSTPGENSESGFGSDSSKYKNGLLPHLRELSLANNPIEKIRNNAFTAATSLLTLDLRSCQISTIEQNAFSSLTMLRKLVLTDNNLANVPSFPSLQLEVLKLGRNNYDRIPKYAFGGLKKLKTLEINGPALSHIESEAFSLNLNLESVDISTCKQLATLPSKLFKNLSGLRNLVLKDNALQSLPEDLVSWTNLHSLRLDGNPIRCTCELFWLQDVLLQNRLRNTSSFVLCAEPKEVRDKKFIEVSTNDLNCYLQGPVQKTILGISIFVAVIFLIIFFFLLYKYHDKIKNTCKRGFRRPPRRKNRSSVISSSAKELDTATKSSFLSQSAYPFSDDEFQVRASLMSGSPGPGSGGNFMHSTSHSLNPVTMNSLNYPYGANSSHNNHSLRYPITHHHHTSANKYSSPSYNEYDAPINAVNYPQYSQQQTPSQIDLPIQYPLHQQHGTLPGMKPIPITEL